MSACATAGLFVTAGAVQVNTSWGELMWFASIRNWSLSANVALFRRAGVPIHIIAVVESRISTVSLGSGVVEYGIAKMKKNSRDPLALSMPVPFDGGQ